MIEHRLLSDVFPYSLILKYEEKQLKKEGQSSISVAKGVGIGVYSQEAIEVSFTAPIHWNLRPIVGDRIRATSLKEQVKVAMELASFVPSEKIWKPNDDRWKIVF